MESNHEEVPEVLEESKLKKIIKRTIIILLSFFLMYLFLSIFLFGYNIFSIFEGRIESAQLMNNQIQWKDYAIIFENDTYTRLTTIYLETQKTEFKVCLRGFKEQNTFYIQDLYIPKTEEQTFNTVEAEICDKNTIISLHSHPFKHCIFSAQDITNFHDVHIVNKDALIGLMCEKDRFTFYDGT